MADVSLLDGVIRALLWGFCVWLCWTKQRLGATYFCFLPEAWQSIPLGHCFGLMFLAGVPRAFVPTFVRIFRSK